MSKTRVTGDLKKMVDGYVEAMLWSSTDPDTERPLDDDYGPEDLTVASWNRAVVDCQDFLTMCAEAGVPLEQPPGQIGHDFWLTRNGHGTGFWDRGLKYGRELTKIADAFGGIDPMPTGNGKVEAL